MSGGGAPQNPTAAAAQSVFQQGQGQQQQQQPMNPALLAGRAMLGGIGSAQDPLMQQRANIQQMQRRMAPQGQVQTPQMPGPVVPGQMPGGQQLTPAMLSQLLAQRAGLMG